MAKRASDSAAAAAANNDNGTDGDNNTNNDEPAGNKPGVQYMVISKAYFYNSPDESTRRNAFVVPSNNAILTATDEQDDFIFVVFTNTAGQTSKGWLRKQDLQKLNE